MFAYGKTKKKKEKKKKKKRKKKKRANSEVLYRAGMTPLSTVIPDRRIQLMYHAVILPNTTPAKEVLEWIPDSRTTKENLAFNYKRIYS